MTPEPWQGGEPGEQQEGVFDLSTLADELLEAARNDLQRKASRLVIHGTKQRAVLMAILAGGGLAEHSSPPAATLHVRHAVDALEDSAFLLTVALAN